MALQIGSTNEPHRSKGRLSRATGWTIGLAILLPIFTHVARADEAPKVLRLEQKLVHGEFMVIGEAEQVTLPEYKVTWPARIDTGATTTSVHAVDIEMFERDGAPWVRFKISDADAKEVIETEKKVVRIAQIKKRGGEEATQERPVVTMDVRIGKVDQRIDVNLTDRRDFEFPILIGRNFLDGIALVDVSRSYIQEPQKSEKSE